MDKSDLINSPIKEYERLLAMDTIIRTGNYPSPEYLANKLEVTKRAIFRYRNILMEDFGAPLKTSKKYGGYYYEDPDFTISDITLNKHESLVLHIAKRLSDMMLYGSELYKSFFRGINSLTNRAAKSSNNQGKVIADRIQFAFPHTDFSMNSKWNSAFENIIFNSLQDGTLLKFKIEDLDAHEPANLINLTALPVYIVMFENSWLLLCIKKEGFKNNFSEIDMKPENFILFDILSIHFVSEYKDSHAKIIKIPTSISSEGRDGPTYASLDSANFEPLHKIWFDFSIAFNTFKDSEEYIIRLCYLRKNSFGYELADDILVDAAHKGQGKFDNIDYTPTSISDSDISNLMQYIFFKFSNYNKFNEGANMSKKENLLEKSPKLTIPEVIEYCKNDLGITFDLMDEEKAKEFLEKNNFFFRLKQYCSTCTEQTKSGKYIGLDFGHLVELSTIDMFLRKLLLKMTIDLEHYLKVKLVNDCQNNAADDGYEVVEKFLESHTKVQETILAGSKLAGYGGNNFEKYLDSPAVWNFVEMITFYDFISFYAFYYDYLHLNCEYTKHFDSVRRIRNACAHNVCMLSSFKAAPGFKSDLETSFELLQGNLGIGNGTISSCMKVPLLNDFAVMLSVYTKLISSPKIKEITLQEIKDFFDGRMIYRKQYFEGNVDIKNAYQFARRVLD